MPKVKKGRKEGNAKNSKNEAKVEMRKGVEMPAPMEWIKVKFDPDDQKFTYRDREKEMEADNNASDYPVLSVDEYVRSIRPELMEDSKPKIEQNIKPELCDPDFQSNESNYEIIEAMDDETRYDQPNSKSTERPNSSMLCKRFESIRHAATADVNLVSDVNGKEDQGKNYETESDSSDDDSELDLEDLMQKYGVEDDSDESYENSIDEIELEAIKKRYKSYCILLETISNDSEFDESNSENEVEVINDEPNNDSSHNEATERHISGRCTNIGGVYHAETADVNFIFDVDGKKELVAAHKCILAANSQIFHQIFYDSEPKEIRDIESTDTTVDAFVDFIEFLYGAKFVHKESFSKLKISSLVQLAHKYHVHWLKEECKNILGLFIDKYLETVLWVFPLADLCSFDELRLKCIEKIRMNANAIINSDDFINCEQSVVNEILSTDFLGRNEVNVFENCIKWVKRACEKADLDAESPENIRAQFGECFNLIQFESMSAQQFVKCLSVNTKFFTFDEIQTLSSKVSGTEVHQDTIEPLMTTDDILFNRNDSADDIRVEKEVKNDGSFLKSLFEDQTTADITLILTDAGNDVKQRIPVHKCILAQKSKVFADLFKDSTEKNEGIHIVCASVEVFEHFLQLIYTFDQTECDSVMENIPVKNVDAILSLAKEYKVQLIIALYSFNLVMNLNKRNVMWSFERAHKHSMNSLKSNCCEFLKKKGEKAIMSESFLEIGRETLKSVLQARSWDNVKLVVDACMKWAKKYCEKNQLDPANPKDLRVAFGDAFELIPFAAMGLSEFNEFEYDNDAMFTAEEKCNVYSMLAKRRKQT